MIKKWIAWINYGMAALIIGLLLAALFFLFMRPTDFPIYDISARKVDMPKGAFARSQQQYNAIGPPALNLNFSPLSVQLPDLRRYLVYYGKNSRPDAKDDQPALYFAFTGNKTPASILPGEKNFVMYDKSQTPNQYVFSPNNDKTPLWLEAQAQGPAAIVKVRMSTENGQEIKEPASYAEFSLPEKEFVRFGGGATWEIGKWRVDGTLLARQKARWFGIDKFLEKHGGDEYRESLHKQRIDFGEGESAYSVYVKNGDCLVWDDETWKAVKPGDATLKHPLMCVKKIDDRVMNLELWDVDGKGKISLNLIKANEAWLPQNLEQNFKFVGARTRSQFVFEVNNERMLLSPHDWLLLTDGVWKKLKTPEEIDDYVERKTPGPLFVFDNIERKDDRQVIIGTLFNAARTEMVTIELPLQQGTNGASGPTGRNAPDEKRQKVKETNVPPVVKTGEKHHQPPSGVQNINEE